MGRFILDWSLYAYVPTQRWAHADTRVRNRLVRQDCVAVETRGIPAARGGSQGHEGEPQVRLVDKIVQLIREVPSNGHDVEDQVDDLRYIIKQAQDVLVVVLSSVREAECCK
jgi:hypothetical protein